MATQAFTRIAFIAAAWNIFVGSMGMLGWILHADVLKGGFPGYTTMKFNTALGIFLIGLVLLSQVLAGMNNGKRVYEKAASVLVLLIGFLTLIEHALGNNFGIDELLFMQPLGPTDVGYPGRMGPNSAICFVLSGSALLLLDSKDVWYQRLYQSLSVLVFFIAFISLVGYLYDASVLFAARGYARMAIYTALCFSSFAVGLIALRPHHGIGAVLAQGNFAGAGVRMLLPMTMLAPIVIGWFQLQGQKAGLYSTEYGLSLMVTLCVAILSAFAVWNARSQGIAEHINKRAESQNESLLDELKLIKVELEERVQVRTKELNRALVERDVLLQEVHHRVKNNLQVISSLINMQLRKLKSDAARPELEECRSRIFAISFIHQQLYQSKNYSDVAFPQYARQLIGYIAEAAGVLTEGVQLDIDMQELPLGVDRAIPCGLILNELITNAFKHAFPSGRRGIIRVQWKQVGNEFQLLVEDDGIGMAESIGNDPNDSLGLLLIRTLAEQLDGQVEFTRQSGTRCLIRFPAEAVNDD